MADNWNQFSPTQQPGGNEWEQFSPTSDSRETRRAGPKSIGDVAEPTATQFATEAVTGYPQRVARDFLASEELGQRAGSDILAGRFNSLGELGGLTLASLAGYTGAPFAPVSAALDPVADIVDTHISKPVQEMTNLSALEDAFGLVPKGQKPTATGIPHELTTSTIMALPALFAPEGARTAESERGITGRTPAGPGGDDAHHAAVRVLANEGVSLTPGQRRGGVYKRQEDAGTSVLGVGDVIRSGQRNGVESLNRAAVNRALKPIGDQLPATIKPGHDAIDWAQQRLSQAYQDLLPRLRIEPDQTFGDEAKQIMNEHRDMDPGQLQTFQRIVNREVLQPLQRSATGETAKSVEEWLGHEIARNMKSDDYNVRHLGLALEDIQDSLRGMIARHNPEYSVELGKINQGYANFKRVQRAAAASRDGVFSPSQLDNAVKALDRSKDRGSYARGKALMQDLSGSAVKVLPSSVPDSGTPTRMLAALLLGGQVNPLIPIGALTAAYPYSRTAMARASARMTEAGAYGGNILRRFAAQLPKTRNYLASAQAASQLGRFRKQPIDETAP